MVFNNQSTCPLCEGKLIYYDTVSRTIIGKYRSTSTIKLQRLKCSKCGKIHRSIPKGILPYKQYEAEIIFGVIEGLISFDTFGFEDYPCEQTMYRWLTHELQLLLWKET